MKKHGWVFTLNNYFEGEMPLVRNYDQPQGVEFYSGPVPVWDHEDLVFLGYGKEVARTGTPHLQGVAVFKRPVGLRTLKRLNSRAHFQPMRGSFDEAHAYASKENFVYWCEPGRQIESVKGLVDQDHLRAKVIADEETTIVNLTEKIDKLTKLIEILDSNLEKKIQKSLDEKLNGLLYKDKFV